MQAARQQQQRALRLAQRQRPAAAQVQVHAQQQRSLSGNAVVSEPVPRYQMYTGVKTGAGGRHSNSGQKVAVFGATGFMGQYVVNQLGKHGTNVVVTTRGDDISWRHLKVCGDYGKIVPAYIHIKDEDSLRTAIAGCDTVINLMGKYYETRHIIPTFVNCSFRDVHVDAAEAVARIAREEECKHLVHVSCAYANPDSAAEFARTKAEGDAKVLEQFPGAVLVKPNVMYGEEDRYLNILGRALKVLPAMPLLDGGRATARPVFVGDVGLAVATIAMNYATAGKAFNLSGAHEYTHRQVIEYVMDQTEKKLDFAEVPPNVAEMVGKAFSYAPEPVFTHDTLALQQENCPGPSAADSTFTDLGMDQVADFETKAFNFLYRFKQGGHFPDVKAREAN